MEGKEKVKEKKGLSKKRFRTKFPMARIKKIMQANEDVGKIAQATPVLVSKCLEMFLQDLINKICEATRQKHGRTMTLSHLKQCVQVHSAFDFLIPLSEKVPDISEKAERRGRPKKEDSSKETVDDDMETMDTIDNEEYDSDPDEDEMEEEDELESPVPVKQKKRKPPPPPITAITTSTMTITPLNHNNITIDKPILSPSPQKVKLNHPPGFNGIVIGNNKTTEMSPKTPTTITTTTTTHHNGVSLKGNGISSSSSQSPSPTPTKININSLINSNDISPNENEKHIMNFFQSKIISPSNILISPSNMLMATTSRPSKPVFNYDEDFDEEEVVAEG